MRIDSQTKDAVLAELAVLLASSQMPVQMRVAEEAGVAQSLVSRARNGQLRRVTSKVSRLIEYARSRVNADELAAIAAAEMDAEEGSENGGAAFALPRPGAAHQAASDRFQRKALEGVQAYLADGYDPRLVVEQLAVLRRAQRVRRPGRASRSDD